MRIKQKILNIPHCVKKNTPCVNIVILLASHMFSYGPLKIQPPRVSCLIGTLSILAKVLDNYIAVTPTIDSYLHAIFVRVSFSRYHSMKEDKCACLGGSNTCMRSKRSCPEDLRVLQPGWGTR
jgi:hypothetical protein